MKVTELLQTGKTCAFCTSFDKLGEITAETVANAANQGDKTALEVYKISAEKLGVLLSVIIDLLNPQMIVIGSVYTRCSNLMKEHVEKIIDKEVLEYSRKACVVSEAVLGDSIGDYAALSVAYYGKEKENDFKQA